MLGGYSYVRGPLFTPRRGKSWCCPMRRPLLARRRPELEDIAGNVATCAVRYHTLDSDHHHYVGQCLLLVRRPQRGICFTSNFLRQLEAL